MAALSNIKSFPSIDIIIPTLNAAKVLSKCLSSIKKQKYPSSKVNIFIIDGGSSDDTIGIAKKYHAKIFSNPLKTAEAGKAVGLKNLQSEYFALIDSDNILPHKNWLTKMLFPLIQNKSIIGSEPWEYTYRKSGGFIERYSSLTGVNDPYSLIIGNFDRKNYIYPSWTNINLKQSDKDSYLLVELNPKTLLPTIGANGTIFRSSIFKNFKSNYFFDVDFIYHLNKIVLFAKVKTSIIHTFCESSVLKFIRKQKRRINDAYFYQKYRFNPVFSNNLFKTFKFIIYTILILPTFFTAIIGYFKKPDFAWFFHPLACYITLVIYTYYFLLHLLGYTTIQNRTKWSQ